MKKLLMILLMSVLLIGCGNTNTTDTEAYNGEDAQQTQTQEAETEKDTIHTHAYTESITTEATCEADGVKTFTCECGDSYTEPITATGHSYGEYVYNNDATTSADGTETATCSVCGGTDTRTKAGTKIEIAYDGYDEFGNGYVMGDDGYKHFDCACPYPLFQVEDGGSWVSGYSVYGVRGVSSECKTILDQRYPDTAHNKTNNRVERYAVGYYKEGLVFYEKWAH